MPDASYGATEVPSQDLKAIGTALAPCASLLSALTERK